MGDLDEAAGGADAIACSRERTLHSSRRCQPGTVRDVKWYPSVPRKCTLGKPATGEPFWFISHRRIFTEILPCSAELSHHVARAQNGTKWLR
jgi:hypothetical protein